MQLEQPEQVTGRTHSMQKQKEFQRLLQMQREGTLT
jgi:hypothetical protein